eukprot:4668221-Prymnesium_polylepis.1
MRCGARAVCASCCGASRIWSVLHARPVCCFTRARADAPLQARLMRIEQERLAAEAEEAQRLEAARAAERAQSERVYAALLAELSGGVVEGLAAAAADECLAKR